MPRLRSRCPGPMRSTVLKPGNRALACLRRTGSGRVRAVSRLAYAADPHLPDALSDGSPFPGRDYILFITFCVILATLVLQGLSLPLVIRRLGVVDDGLANVDGRS